MLGSQEAILNACFIIHGQRYGFLVKPGIGKLQKNKRDAAHAASLLC